jgi:hypothetical protein
VDALPGLRLSEASSEPARSRLAAEAPPGASRFEDQLSGARSRTAEFADGSERPPGPGRADGRETRARPAERDSGPGRGQLEAKPEREAAARAANDSRETHATAASPSKAGGRATPQAGAAGQPAEVGGPSGPDAASDLAPGAASDGASVAGSDGTGVVSPTPAAPPATAAAEPNLIAATGVPAQPSTTGPSERPSPSHVAAGAEDGIVALALESAGEAPAAEVPAVTAAEDAHGPSGPNDDALARGRFELALAKHDQGRESAPVSEAHEARSHQAARPQPAHEAAAEILRQVRVGLSSDLREANIQLAPEALGRVSIRLRVEHGALVADVRAESSQALRALELHAPELKAALAQGGIEPRSLAFGFMDQHAGRASDHGHAPRRSTPFAGEGRDEFSPLAPVAVERALARRLSASGVDTYA